MAIAPTTYILIKGNAAWQFHSSHSCYRDIDQLADFIIGIRGNGTVVLEKNRCKTDVDNYGKLVFVNVESCLRYINDFYSNWINIEELCSKVVDLTRSEISVLDYIKECHDNIQLRELGIKE